MMAPLIVDVAPFASPVAFDATAGIYTASCLPTLAEVRDRRRQPQPCVCTDGSCRRCELDDDATFARSQDI